MGTSASRILKLVDVTGEKFKESDFIEIRASSWHGTMVACAACGKGRASKGYYKGIAHDASVVLIKTFDGRVIRSRNIYKALQWIVKNHSEYSIRIVNISVGGDASGSIYSKRICDAIDKLNKLGISVVTAAGNDPAKSVVAPACCPGAITVGGIDDNNTLEGKEITEYGTSFGETSDQQQKPDIFAPARYLPAPMLEDNEVFEESRALFALLKLPAKLLKSELGKYIKRTHLERSLKNRNPKEIRKAIKERMQEEKFFAPGYQHVDGTSFSSAIVSSVIAQMLEANSSLGPETIKKIILKTAKQLSGIEPGRQGNGIIVAHKCVERVLEEAFLNSSQPYPRVTPDKIIFCFTAREAKSVILAGDFTDWMNDKIAMERVNDFQWRADLPLLAAGNYRYKFLIDDDKWIHDPDNPLNEKDPFGGLNSVLVVNSI
jgi:serine protease AprX